ncbi:MAG: O-antigen ligase family protein [Ignavibacteriales bacterium]|nr:O-antigen ligase family protein [Ignavibacteriales bacterium]
MLTLKKIRSLTIPQIVFCLSVLQIVVLSFSIAAASISFGLMVFLMLVWWRRDHRGVWHATPIDYFVLLYVAIEFLTAATAVYPAEAFQNAKRLLLILNLYILLSVVDSQRKIEILVGSLIAFTALQSLGEIAYYFLNNENRLYIFQHYMTTGGIKMIVCLLTIPVILQRGIPGKWRIAALTLLVPTLVALVLTDTRSSWLGFIAGAGLIAVLKEKKLILVIVALVIAFFFFAPQKNIDRAKSVIDLNHPSNAGRLTMWSTGLKIFVDHPLLGVGDSDLMEIYKKYRNPGDDEPAGHLHNNYIMLLVTIGLIGFTIVMAVFGRVIVAEYRIFKKLSSDSIGSAIALGALAVFCGFLVNGLFEWNFGSHQIMVLVWSSVGLALAAERMSAQEAIT